MMDIALHADFQVGESPVWIGADRGLVFVDVPAGQVHSMGPGSTTTRVLVDAGQPVGAVVPRAGGGFVLATRDGVCALADDGTLTTLLPLEADVDSRRANDAVAGPGGHLYVGTTTYSHDQPTGVLYRVDPDLTVHTVADELTLANGIAFSPDGAHAYFTDSVTRRVDVFDHDATTGALHDRRPFAETGPDGYPDGLTIDADGGLWVALWSAGVLHRYGSDGTLDAVVDVPVPGVTNCAFGGDALDELYVTTGTFPPAPDAGSIYRYSPGVRGLAPSAFSG